jgi:cytochrome c553
MNIKLVSFLVFASIALASIPAGAESLVDGSAEAGKAKSITCSACHGQDGNSVMPTWPSIAGQSAAYIATQLHAFKDGLRSDPLMSAQSMLLSDEDIRNLAVYFESLPRAAMPVADANKVSRGQALYRGGDSAAGVAACMACHGPTGRGNPAAGYPAVSGQHATYTAKQLQDYAAGTRQSDGKTRIMRDLAARLDKEDIDAVASYMQGLH